MASPETVAEPKLRIVGLEKKFTTVKGDTFQALAPVDITINKGDFVTVVGPSGCGKTTLLRIIAGLEKQSDGELTILDEDSSRPDTSVVFQEESIFPWMSVWDNVAYGLVNRRVPKAQIKETVEFWIQKVGLGRFKDAYPHQLSGGMRQRVSVARAFANDPEVLLMDEPFSALDEQNRTILQQELVRIWEETRKTVIFVTHSIDEALTLSDYVLLMSASPGHIKAKIPVPFPRPRDIVEIRAEHEYGVLQQQIWDQLIGEVEQARRRERETK